MKKIKKTGFYGGTFSPPHNGHTNFVRAFCEKFKPDEMIIMPAAIPPHKELPGGASTEQRFEMTKLAFENVAADAGKLTVSSYEIERSEKKSYTYDTIRHFRSADKTIYLLCGTDMLLSFDKWYKADKLFKMCEIVYSYRNTDDPENEEFIEKTAAGFREVYGAVIHRLDCDIVDISSSEIRQMISEGKDASAYLSGKVYDYIKENGLYEYH